MMKEWSFFKIKDYPIQIIDGDRGTNYPTKEEFQQEGYCLFLNTGNVSLSGFNFDEKSFITEEKHKKLRKGHLQRNDSVLTTRGTIGNVAFYGDTIAYDVVRINSGMLVLRPDQTKLDPRFFYGLLRSSIFQQQADLFRYGAAQPQLPIATLKHIRLPLPPLSAQQKIAGILAAYDDLIENNLKRIRLLEEMAQITYEEWFVHLRFPGHETTPINPETSLQKGWKKTKLKDILILNYGKSLTADTRLKGNIPVYGSSGIVGTHNEPLVDGPSIIVGRKGNVGSVFWSHSSFYPIDTVYFVTSKHTLPFLYFALKNSKFNNSDAAVPGLNRDAAYAVEIILPSEDVEKKFSAIGQQNFEAIQILESQNQRLREARDILLPRLMTGMIDVESYAPNQLFKDAA